MPGATLWPPSGISAYVGGQAAGGQADTLSGAETGFTMVQIRSRHPMTVYEVMDEGGRPIGEVMQPCGEPLFGLGVGTVYLRREMGRTSDTD
jgi:hypothetical protein